MRVFVFLLLCLLLLSHNSLASDSKGAALPDDTAAPDAARGTVFTSSPTGQTQLVPRSHMRINDADTETRFLELVRAKNSTVEELMVVQRLLVEKKAESEIFQKELQEKFSMKPDGDYRYDRKSHTIYDFDEGPALNAESGSQSTNGADVADNNMQIRKPKLRVVRQLNTQEEIAGFIRLNSSKTLTGDEMRVLALLAREKELELSQIEASLSQSFSITKDRDYHYDRKTRTLYELVPVPASTGPDEKKPEATGKSDAAGDDLRDLLSGKGGEQE